MKAPSSLRNVLGEARGFEVTLAKMHGGVVYTLLCIINSVCVLDTMMLLVLIGLSAVVPGGNNMSSEASPVWAVVNAYMLLVARMMGPMLGVPEPLVMNDKGVMVETAAFENVMSNQYGLVLFWFAVMAWVPFAVVAVMAALLGRYFGWSGPVLGKLALAFSLPGRMWTGLMRLLFGWMIRHKMGFIKAAGLTALSTPYAQPELTKTYRWGNKYASGMKTVSRGPNPYFPIYILIWLFLFFSTVICYGASAMPYLGLFFVCKQATRDPSALGYVGSNEWISYVIAALMGLTLGVWMPAASDFYHRYGAHLTVRQRFDWFPLMPRLVDLVGRDAAKRLKAAESVAGASDSSVPPVAASAGSDGTSARQGNMLAQPNRAATLVGLLIMAASLLLVIWLVTLLFHANVPWLLIAAIICVLIGFVIAATSGRKQG